MSGAVRITVFIIGVALAAAGGVIAFRALYVEPPASVVVTDTGVDERPELLRVGGGLLLLATGAAAAYQALRKDRRI